MVIQALPEYTFNCALVVSHQISPVTEIEFDGAVDCEILLEIGFQILFVALYTFSTSLTLSYQSWPVKGAFGGV